MRKFFNYDTEMRATVEELENDRVHLVIFSEISDDIMLSVNVHESWAEHYLASYLEMDNDLADHRDSECLFEIDFGGSQ